MIDIPVDESYAYDVLSIAAVKVAKKSDDRVNLDNHHRLEKRIGEQVGWPLHIDIVASPEYAELYQTNLALFNHIDAMKTRQEQLGDGQAVDRFNYLRYTLKKQLQTKFFPDRPLTEKKIGYQ
jgi:hypothetical protein